TTGRARILDNKRLINQLAALERTTTASGDKVDHVRGAHDDCANVVCGALVLASAVKHDVIPLTPPMIIGGPHDNTSQFIHGGQQPDLYGRGWSQTRAGGY